jgi:site-specific recombinase XerD
MEGVTIKPDGQGRLLVTFPYSEARVEQIRRLPDRRWLPELKAWSIPDTPEARAALAEIFAAPPKPTGEWIGVAPRKPEKDGDRKPHASRVPGKPLTTNPPHPLIKAVDDELVLRGMAYPQGAFGSGTRKSYGQHLRNYFEWLDAKRLKAGEATREDIRSYLVQMANSGRVSAGYCRGARAALMLLYEAVLKQSGKVCDLPRMKRPEQLPVVLSREEVARLLKVVDNLKHKALLMTAYSAGLRVGEAVRLKLALSVAEGVSDIDSKRMQIRVTAGKGAKDRYTLLSETALAVLREYFQAYKPKDWLFAGDDAGDHLSERSAQQVFQDARKKAGIIKPATFHTLRHSFATHLLEDGVDIRYIQELLGHGTVETTQRYTHVTQKGMERIKSPLDNLKL